MIDEIEGVISDIEHGTADKTSIATLRRVQKAMRWQPIETAPKDGTVILVGCWQHSNWRYTHSQFVKKGEWTDKKAWTGWMKDPTHWRLIAPPGES